MPGQNFINGPPNPRGVERYTLDGKIPIDQQSESLILKVTGLKKKLKKLTIQKNNFLIEFIFNKIYL